MHKRGVSLVLSLIITANLIPTNLVQAHADEINTNSEVIVDENVLGETPEIEDVKRNEELVFWVDVDIDLCKFLLNRLINYNL